MRNAGADQTLTRAIKRGRLCKKGVTNRKRKYKQKVFFHAMPVIRFAAKVMRMFQKNKSKLGNFNFETPIVSKFYQICYRKAPNFKNKTLSLRRYYTSETL